MALASPLDPLSPLSLPGSGRGLSGSGSGARTGSGCAAALAACCTTASAKARSRAASSPARFASARSRFATASMRLLSRRSCSGSALVGPEGTPLRREDATAAPEPRTSPASPAINRLRAPVGLVCSTG